MHLKKAQLAQWVEIGLYVMPIALCSNVGDQHHTKLSLWRNESEKLCGSMYKHINVMTMEDCTAVCKTLSFRLNAMIGQTFHGPVLSIYS